MKLLFISILFLISGQSYAQEDTSFDPFGQYDSYEEEEVVESAQTIIERLTTTYCSQANAFLDRELIDNTEWQAILSKELNVYNDLCQNSALTKVDLNIQAVDSFYYTYVRLQNSWATIAKTLEPETELDSLYFYEIKQDLLNSREIFSPYNVESEFSIFYSQTLNYSDIYDLALKLRVAAIKRNEELRR